MFILQNITTAHINKDDNNSVSNDGVFVFPSQYQKKLNRQALKSSRSIPPPPGHENNGALSKQVKNKKPGIWGKSKSTKVSTFKGVPREIPKAFVYRCDQQAKESDVAEFLKDENINVTEGKLASHVNAFLKSFIVSVMLVRKKILINC